MGTLTNSNIWYSPLAETDDLNTWPNTENFLAPEKIKSKFDLLVLSCALYRLYKLGQPFNTWSITNAKQLIQDEVNAEDHALAKVIRDHYKGKLLTFKLTKGVLSKFKTDLNTFLSTDYLDVDGFYKTPDTFIGMTYKLPYFYEYDTSQLSLFELSNITVIGDDKFLGIKTLSFLGKLNPATNRSKNKTEYWFNEENGNRVVLIMDKTNPLLPVFDKILDKPIEVQSFYDKRTHYSVEYYVSRDHWKLNL